MTRLSVVSSLTTVGGSGLVELGDVAVDRVTVGGVKKRVEQETRVSAQGQKLWWKGYILDNDSLLLKDACVGKWKGLNDAQC